MFAFEIRKRLPANMVAYQADVHFWILRLQLLSALHSTPDGKLVQNRLLLRRLITTPIHQDIFFNSSACRTFIIRDSLGFVICQYRSVKKCSFVVTVAN